MVRTRENLCDYYNPGLIIEEEILEGLMAKVETPVIWVGDFNAHSELWGSRFRDRNGIVLEEFMDKHGLVVLNDGRPTRFQVNQGGSSCLDLTFTSPDLALRG